MNFQNISKMPISYVEDMIHTPILQDDTIDILERSEAFTYLSLWITTLLFNPNFIISW